MDEAFKVLIQVAPWGFVIIALEYLKIKAAADTQKERDTNAKEKAQADRESQQYVAKTYADAINALAKSITDQAMRTESSINEFKNSVLEQYKNMGITQELLEMAKIRLKEQIKK